MLLTMLTITLGAVLAAAIALVWIGTDKAWIEECEDREADEARWREPTEDERKEFNIPDGRK